MSQDLRTVATQLIRGIGDLFPKQHVEKAMNPLFLDILCFWMFLVLGLKGKESWPIQSAERPLREPKLKSLCRQLQRKRPRGLKMRSC